MTNAGERKPDLVLVGGGHAHVQVLRRFAMDPPAARVTLVVDSPIAVYSGMVPGYVAGQYRADELEIDVVPLARRAGARVVLASALRIDAAARLIHAAERAPLRYDVASVDIGSTVAGLDLPGVRENAVPTRPIAELVRRTDSLVERIRSRPRGAPFRVVVVGGGAGGVELAFTLWQRIDAGSDPAIEVSLVHAWPELLLDYPRSFVARVHRNADKRGIRVSPLRRVVAARGSALRFDDGASMPFDALIWVTGAVSHPLFADSGLPTEPRGFVRTRSTLQVEGFDDLFAVGDCATMTEFPRTPKAGVYAVRQGPVLIDNLRAWLEKKPLGRYRPQADFLTLLNLGDGTALGAKWGRSFEGAWVMRLKDRIDRRFMQKFQVLDREGSLTEEFGRLPDMSRGMEILCGGCAAKVGQRPLERALSRLAPRPKDDSVKLGLQAPDDAAAFETPGGELVVSTIDAFRAFTDDPYLVGRVAAVNALSDIQAKGASPRYALALVAVPRDLDETDSEEILYQVLAGARFVFDRHRVSLIGGHTITAPELLVGFSVDGFSPGARLLSIDKLEPGDQLLLTKGLGTGVVLHADMLGRASGRWLLSCFESMLTSNGEAAAIALELGAKAVTDVTGFGLAGHLGAMLRASGVSAILDVAELPVLPGALELLDQGFRSTSHAENAKARKGILVRPEAAADPRVELLFDPQTSGGLLFGLKASRVDEALERFERVSRIGEVGPGGGEASIEIVSRKSAAEALVTRRRT
jgi:selenide,water dikinase